MSKLATRLLCGLAVLLLAPGLVFAQDGTITGTVTDGETGEPLPGATVQIPETGDGAATDANGEYTLSVAEGTYTLSATFVGYSPVERDVEVVAGETVTVDITLEVAPEQLGEVVVQGLGLGQDRARSRVSIGRVDASDIAERASFDNVSQLISGNVAGVSAQASSGNIGGGIRFNVRGGGGLGGDGQPAIYIDGTRVDNNEIEGFGAGGQGISPLADLNPADIENIDIIRGPAGAAIYGTDGSNGVVLITTKGGSFSADPTLNVEYRGTAGWSEQENEYSSRNHVTADDANALFGTGSLQEHQVSVSGGADFARFYASVNHRMEEGTIANNEGERTNLRANFEAFPTDDFSLRASAGYTINELQRPDNDNNVQGWLGNTLLLPTPYLFTDSLAIANLEDVQKINRFNGSLRASWEPIENLNLQATGGFDTSTRRQDRTRPPGFAYAGIGTDGERNIFTRQNDNFNFDAQASYAYGITDGLQATTLLGGQYTDVTRRTSFSTTRGFGNQLITDIGAGDELFSIGEGLVNTRTSGLFVQQELVYDDTYTITGMLRRDVATALGEDVSDVFYPSVTGSVTLSNFDWTPDFFTFLSARAAYGETGQLPGVLDAQSLRFSATVADFGAGASISSVGNPEIVPERIQELELGIDADISDRYSFEGTYWYNWAGDSIIDAPLASSTGFGFQSLPANVGSIESQGVEVTLGATPLLSETARVDLTFTYGYQWTEVQDLGPDRDEIFGGFNRNVLRPGSPRQAFFLVPVTGALFDANGVYAGPETGAREVVGQPIPEHTGGFRVNATLFSNLSVSAFAEYALGHQVLNNTAGFGAGTGGYPIRNELQAQLGELTPGTAEYIDVANRLAQTNSNFDSNFVEDADWLKLREVSVRYNFSDLIQRSGSAPIQNLTVGLAARNLFTITEYSGPDPEVNFTGGRGLIRGQDFLTLPNSRQFQVNVTLGF
ncbi:MAG: TonB-dependent receptor [Longimonas sp.]|uniref:carboxypeptidase-like regulatory domain-containing protein n=1 Tax=Longimonas sp. TaxID=2039626 RepID=UPI00334EA359